MVTPRTVNIGPLYKPDGATLLTGVSLKFALVNGKGKKTAGYDTITGAQIAGEVTAVTDVNGTATAVLVPNDQLAGTTYYAVNPADAYSYTQFRAYLASGSGAITFADLYVNNVAPPSGEWSSFQTHAQDDNKHLTPNEDLALSNANSPSAGNPIATMADVSGGSFTNLPDTPANYTGQSGKVVSVNLTEDGLEFSSAGGVSDHGALTGLTDDDHAQYHNDARGDARYAPIANGVTNGNTHDHSGGDGAQVDHVNLASKGTNTHAQLDAHVVSISNPHSVTAGQAGAEVADATIMKTGSAEVVTGDHDYSGGTFRLPSSAGTPTGANDEGDVVWDTVNNKLYVGLGGTGWKEIRMQIYRIDDFYTFTVNTHAVSTGAATDADAVPTYRVYEDETGTAILSGSMAKLDDINTTGFYSARIQLTALNGFEEGKSYNIYISATVGGTAGTTQRFLQL